MRTIAITALAALFAMSGAAVAGDFMSPHDNMTMGQEQQSQSDSFSQIQQPITIDQRDSSSQRVESDDYPVAQAWAAPLTSSNDTCMGSSSAGGQAATFGVSIATTWRDGACVRRKDARLLHNMGLHGVAAALMCQKNDVAAAFEAAGVPCAAPQVIEERAIVIPAAIIEEHGQASDNQSSSFSPWGEGHGFIH